MRTLLVGFTLALLAGCSYLDPAPPEATAPRLESGEEVTLERLRTEPYSFTYYSGLRTPTRTVVQSDAEWERTWAAIWESYTPTPERPAIDFSREVVVVAAMGVRASGGYTILLEGVVQRDGFIEVLVRETSPGQRCGATAALTQPVDLARMPRTGQPVRFSVHSEVYECD